MKATARRYVARTRGPLVPLGLLSIVTGVLLGQGWLAPVGAVAIVAAIVGYFVPTEQPGLTPVAVRPPVRGRWLAINSPADKVPSHGTRELGQSYAIDLVYAPDPAATWRGVYWWPPSRRPGAFPGFGQPVLAPATGTVVRATGWQRDHLSRNSPWGLVYLLPEMVIRAAVSVHNGQFVLGNHIILDLGDGVYAALAHLKRGTNRVRPGQRVQAGEQLAECGNSGNTSEPHLHFQLMDHRRPVLAAGVPFDFDKYLVDGEPQTGVPDGNRPFTVPPEPGTPS